MKWHWFGLIAGVLLYILALIPGLPPHRADVLFMILSGMLVASISILGFDTPHPSRKLGLMLVAIGALLFLGSALMAAFEHPYVLFIIAVPSLGLALFGVRILVAKDVSE